jgi:poly(A) polymerase
VKAQIYFAKDHEIDPALIDEDALYVLKKLRESGFTAYLVGGSVRDLLIRKVPKDFDISTSARPEQIKSIFQRRCILIGRRFRLAHVRFGHKIIEVATFRSGENDSDLIVQDNEWGTPEQDVLRRDFTINGLFYDASNHSVIDFVNGWQDIQDHVLRMIGEPEIRFKQDPVRILRMFKFQARYGFHIHPDTKKAADSCRSEILKSSTARVLEEIFKMLESGASSPFFRLLAENEFLSLLFPRLMDALHSPEGKQIFHYLSCADKIYKHSGKNSLDRGILCTCLIFPLLEKELQEQLKNGHYPHIGEITLITSSLIKHILINSFSHFPRKISSSMVSIIVDQFRITPLSGKRHYRDKLLRHKDFHLALQFLKIRALVDERWVEIYTSIRNQYRQLSHPDRTRHRPYRQEHAQERRESHVR